MSSAMMIVPVLVTVTLPRSVVKAPPKVVFALPEFISIVVVLPPPAVPAMVESVIAPSSVVSATSAASRSVIPVSKSKVFPSPSKSIVGSVPLNSTPVPLLKITSSVKLYSTSTPVPESVILPLAALPIAVAAAPLSPSPSPI